MQERRERRAEALLGRLCISVISPTHNHTYTRAHLNGMAFNFSFQSQSHHEHTYAVCALEFIDPTDAFIHTQIFITTGCIAHSADLVDESIGWWSRDGNQMEFRQSAAATATVDNRIDFTFGFVRFRKLWFLFACSEITKARVCHKACLYIMFVDEKPMISPLWIHILEKYHICRGHRSPDTQICQPNKTQRETKNNVRQA